MKKNLFKLITAGITVAAALTICSTIAYADEWDINPIGDTGGPTITNQASVTSENGKAVSGAASNTVTTKVTNTNLSIKKATVGDVSDIRAGDQITYKITVTNSGDHIAQNVRVTDTINKSQVTYVSATGGTVTAPASSNDVVWVIPTIGIDQSVDLTLIVKVNDGQTSGTISNTAKIVQENGANLNIASAAVNVTIKAPVLKVTKAVSAAQARRGETLTYTITVQNTGTGSARNVQVTDNLNSNLDATGTQASFKNITGTSTIAVSGQKAVISTAKIAAGASVQYSFTAKIKADAA